MKHTVALAVVFACALTVWAQQMSTVPKASAKQVVSFEPPEAVNVAAGKPETVKLHFIIASGLHVNSNQPVSNLLIPTSLWLELPTDIGATTKYPPGQLVALQFSPNDKASLYTGAFDIETRLSADRTASPGRYNVHGDLTYQACNDRQCLPPQKLPIVFAITVGKSRIAPERKRLHGNAQSPHIH